MSIKISGAVESLFSQAVALDQSSTAKNTIYATGNEIYILNHDHTILIRFRLRKSEASFPVPVSFRANDYDSNEFYEEAGKIVFLQKEGAYQRKKSCSAPDYTPEQVKLLFTRYLDAGEERIEVPLPKKILSLLDRDLSHMEFSAEKGGTLRIIQRNIYSGAVIEIQEKSDGLIQATTMPFDLEPVAIRTNDFAALYSFQQEYLKFGFVKSGGLGDFLKVKSPDPVRRDMMCVIACCLYDEIAEIKEALHGRQK